MKRTIISFDFNPSSKMGGQERSLFDILVGLKSMGHSVKLGYIESGDLLPKYREAGIETIEIPRLYISNIRSIKQIFEFLKTALSFGFPFFSTIYVNQIADTPLGSLIKILFFGKLVCHIRLPPPPYLSGQYSLAVRFVDSFIVATKKMKDSYLNLKLRVDKIKIVPNAFNFENIEIKRKPAILGVLRVVYLGRISSEKGIETLIKAIFLLKKKGVMVHLTVGGDIINPKQKGYFELLKKIIFRLKLEDEISFAGHIQNPVDFLSGFDLSVFPSTWDEPFGRVLVETILAGTPVIAHDVGSVKEILAESDEKWIYKNNDPRELCSKIFQFYQYPESYPLKEKFNYMKEHFEIQSVLRKIIAIVS